MIQLLYFGRLDQEKGRDAIIAMIEYFSSVTSRSDTTRSIGDILPHNSYTSPPSNRRSDNKLPFVLHIFGKGSYEKKILQLAEQYPQHIIYYGFQSLDAVKKTAVQCDYCLMPSLFLETFGLSAVNALSRGLPVIGYQQGGMAPFVLEAYDLASNPGSPDVQLIAMMEKIMQKGGHSDGKQCQEIAKKYSKEERVHRVNKLIKPTWIATSSLHSSSQGRSKKILLVTDFVSKLGGIETYVHDVAVLLTQQGYTVEIIGSAGGRTRFSRIFSMLLSAHNIFFARKLHRKIQSFQPDIIWCHSVLRHIGWLGLVTINRSSAQKRMMYHDLGYFHPFPHAVTQENQIPASLDWKDFSVSVHTPIMKFFVRGKWVLLQKIQKQLKRFDQHLVPSAFMENVVRKNYGEKIIVLPHFIQE